MLTSSVSSFPILQVNLSTPCEVICLAKYITIECEQVNQNVGFMFLKPCFPYHRLLTNAHLFSTHQLLYEQVRKILKSLKFYYFKSHQPSHFTTPIKLPNFTLLGFNHLELILPPFVRGQIIKQVQGHHLVVNAVSAGYAAHPSFCAPPTSIPKCTYPRQLIFSKFPKIIF